MTSFSMQDQWKIIHSFLDGGSIIDLDSFPLSSYEQVDHLLNSVGFHHKQNDERIAIQKLFQDSLKFIKEVLLPGTRLTIPQEFYDLVDVRDIFLIAGKRIQKTRRVQIMACAVVRMMHIVFHVNNVYRREDFDIIKKSILEPFHEHIHLAGSKIFFGKGSHAIAIKSFNYRERKSRKSMIIKLLHQTKANAQSIYDQVGIRFVTHNKLDAIYLIRAFREYNIFSFSNILPFRSRNNLIDMKKFMRLYNKCNSARNATFENIETCQQELYSKEIGFKEGKNISDDNDFSDKSYRSLQFTVRKLIRYPHPAYLRKIKMLGLIQKIDASEERTALLKELEEIKAPRILRYFFPYEIQIVDHKTHLENIKGPSSHENYRHKQLDFIRRRLFKNLFKK